MLPGTLELALAASGLDSVTVRHRSRLVSDNGASYTNLLIIIDMLAFMDGLVKIAPGPAEKFLVKGHLGVLWFLNCSHVGGYNGFAILLFR